MVYSYRTLTNLLVPNAPCGVESLEVFFGLGYVDFVPNAPCGVESRRVKV